jgi:hypothetical protein
VTGTTDRKYRWEDSRLAARARSLAAASAVISSRRGLGPNGDVVLDILARAARLTADEARDLIDQETFDVLFGPWREIMHH